jgi:uncharacterized protein (DUF1499 family)
MSLKYVLAGLAILILGFGAYVRLNPIDVKAVHIDPETAERPSHPGHVLLRPGGDIEPTIYPLSKQELADRMDAIILADKRTERIAGNLGEQHATYVARSVLWGFPDIINIKVVEEEGGSSLRILSGLRYGYADMGVNRKRVEAWISQL